MPDERRISSLAGAGVMIRSLNDVGEEEDGVAAGRGRADGTFAEEDVESWLQHGPVEQVACRRWPRRGRRAAVVVLLQEVAASWTNGDGGIARCWWRAPGTAVVLIADGEAGSARRDEDVPGGDVEVQQWRGRRGRRRRGDVEVRWWRSTAAGCRALR